MTKVFQKHITCPLSQIKSLATKKFRSPSNFQDLLDGDQKWVSITIWKSLTLEWQLKFLGCQWLNLKKGHVKFLEGFHRALCVAIEGDRKVVLVALLLATKNVWSLYKWWLKMGFNCHSKNSRLLDGDQKNLIINNYIWKGGM